MAIADLLSLLYILHIYIYAYMLCVRRLIFCAISVICAHTVVDRHLGVYGGFKTESLFVPVFCNADPWADRTRYLLILEIRGSER